MGEANSAGRQGPAGPHRGFSQEVRRRFEHEPVKLNLPHPSPRAGRERAAAAGGKLSASATWIPADLLGSWPIDRRRARHAAASWCNCVRRAAWRWPPASAARAPGPHRAGKFFQRIAIEFGIGPRTSCRLARSGDRARCATRAATASRSSRQAGGSARSAALPTTPTCRSIRSSIDGRRLCPGSPPRSAAPAVQASAGSPR